MDKIRLGRTELMVSRTAFGVLPLQRVDFEMARQILRRAYEGGVNFFDTARGYSDSEEKIGLSLSDVRKDIIIATKCSGAVDRKDVISKTETSLKMLKTDYIDLLQLHNPKEIPDPDDPESTYAGLIELQKKGVVRYIGITNHSRDTAEKAIKSNLFDTLQFPLSIISSENDFLLSALCEQQDMGLIAMKAMCGGLLTNARVAFAGLRKYPNIVPIWGIQRLTELEEFLALENDPPVLDAGMQEVINREIEALSGDFCRACGYCLPCPVEIPIPMAARMSLLMRRMPSEKFYEPEWQEQMNRIESCTNCRACASRCPYGLDTPALLQRQLKEYRQILAAG